MGKSRELVVKISATHQPVPPVGPFQPVEFEGLTVTPWMEEKSFGKDGKRAAQRFSIRATGFKTPGKTAGSASTPVAASAAEKKAS